MKKLDRRKILSLGEPYWIELEQNFLPIVETKDLEIVLPDRQRAAGQGDIEVLILGQFELSEAPDRFPFAVKNLELVVGIVDRLLEVEDESDRPGTCGQVGSGVGTVGAALT